MIEHLGILFGLGKMLKDYLSWKEEPKLVSLKWLEESGFDERLKKEGYVLHWVDPTKVELRKLRGWEVIYEVDKEARTRRWLEAGESRLVLMGKLSSKD